MVRWVDGHVSMDTCVVSKNKVGKHYNHGHTYELLTTCLTSRPMWQVRHRCELLLGAETRDGHYEQVLTREIWDNKSKMCYTRHLHQVVEDAILRGELAMHPRICIKGGKDAFTVCVRFLQAAYVIG